MSPLVDPTHHVPYQDMETGKALSTYRGLHGEKAVAAERKAKAKHDIWLRTRLQAELYSHMDDKGEKSLELHSYKGMADARKRTESLINKITEELVETKYGKAYADGLRKTWRNNPSLIKREVQSLFSTQNMRTYDDIIQRFSESSDILADLNEDPEMRNMMALYSTRLAGYQEKRLELGQELINRRTSKDDYDLIHSHISEHLGKHGLKTKQSVLGEAELARYFQEHLPKAYNPAFGALGDHEDLEKIVAESDAEEDAD